MKINWLSMIRIITVLFSQMGVIIGAMNFIDPKTALVIIGVANGLYLALKCIDGELGISLPDQPAAEASKLPQVDLGGGSAQGAVKLLILAAVCACSMGLTRVCAAENPGAYIHVGPIDFTYPLAHVTATPWLWDFINSRASMAAETTFATFPRADIPFTLGGQACVLHQDTFNIAYGAQTSEQAQFTPIGSLGFNFAKLTTNTGEKITNFGVWCGHDFRDTNPNRCRVITDAGIKASVALW